ncbi:penicillin-binding protein activator [Candidatus Magnetaquicoccus inordinatus]|uniref:penicillin-binding protein activator n=1 Tax=Candidatus Magnetaquicoccus inordinatus TaxID=2496818 RepID=UPI00102C1736|nr:penicillin-binding protein activator [Candidatus Magnetaquicoccus inordinatus]
MTHQTALHREGVACLPSAAILYSAPQANKRRLLWPLLLLSTLLWGCGGQKPLAPVTQQADPSSGRVVITNPPPGTVPIRNMTQSPPPPGSTVSRPILPPVQIAPEPVQVTPSATGKPAPGAATASAKAASPEERALQEAENLYSQAKLPEAWQLWAAIANGTEFPSAIPFYTDKAWQRLLESYLFQASADNTPHFLHAVAEFEPTASQHRILQDMLAQQPRERLKYLLSLQPANSLLAAALRAPIPEHSPSSKPEESMTATAPALALSTAITQPALSAPAATSATMPAAPARKVGLLLPMSGKWSSMGEHLRRAAKKALADYPTTPIQLQIADSGETAESSKKGIQELLNQQVDVIIGPVFYATVQPAIEMASAAQIPIVTLNPQREGDSLPKGAFSNAFQPEQQAKIMAKHAVVDKKLTRIAILAPESEYGRGVAKTFTDEAHALGGAIVRSAYFAQDANDFSPWLKALGTQYDALFLPASAKQVRLIAPQAAAFRTGNQKITLLGTSLWNSPELLAEGGEYLEGALFCDVDNQAKEQFRQSFRQTWEEDPSALAILAYDGVAMIAQLLQDQPMQSGKITPSALTRPGGFRGANGTLRFLENGLSRRPYSIFQIEGGQIRQQQAVRDALAIP